MTADRSRLPREVPCLFLRQRVVVGEYRNSDSLVPHLLQRVEKFRNNQKRTTPAEQMECGRNMLRYLRENHRVLLRISELLRLSDGITVSELIGYLSELYKRGAGISGRECEIIEGLDIVIHRLPNGHLDFSSEKLSEIKRPPSSMGTVESVRGILGEVADTGYLLPPLSDEQCAVVEEELAARAKALTNGSGFFAPDKAQCAEIADGVSLPLLLTGEVLSRL